MPSVSSKERSDLIWPAVALLQTASTTCGPQQIHEHSAGRRYSRSLSRRGEVFEVKPGDQWPLDVAHDGGRTTRERSEIADDPVPPGTVMPAHFEFAVDEGEPTTSPWTIIAQVHQVDFNGQKTYTVPLLFGLEAGDRLFVRATANPINSFQSFHDVVKWESDERFERGRFYRVDITVRMDVGDGSDGILKVKIDDKVVVDYHGQIGIAGTTGYYWKHGIYRSKADDTFAVTFRNSVFGDATCKSSLPIAN